MSKERLANDKWPTITMTLITTVRTFFLTCPIGTDQMWHFKKMLNCKSKNDPWSEFSKTCTRPIITKYVKAPSYVQDAQDAARILPSSTLLSSEPGDLQLAYLWAGIFQTLCFIHWNKCSLISPNNLMRLYQIICSILREITPDVLWFNRVFWSALETWTWHFRQHVIELFLRVWPEFDRVSCCF